jgi:hypothetical protein
MRAPGDSGTDAASPEPLEAMPRPPRTWDRPVPGEPPANGPLHATAGEERSSRPSWLLALLRALSAWPT